MKLAALFSDNAILQRDQPVPVWGWSNSGDKVTVEFAGQKKTATADATGKWLVTLDPMPVSREPRELRANDCRIQNVLVGDVWLCSGQSNMQWSVESSANAIAEIAAAQFFHLRLLTVPNQAKLGPQTEIEAQWRTCSPATARAFSAVGYFFGREVLQQTGIPTGLINASWGGTRIEAWMSRAALLSDPAGRKIVEELDACLASPEAKAAGAKPFDLEKWVNAQGKPDPGNSGLAKSWAAPDFDDNAWGTMALPLPWQFAGHNVSGVFWFRREVDVPAAAAGQDAVLHIGACDKTDTTYFNGVPVGAIGFETKSSWNQPRVYRIPGKLVRSGRNVIAVRVYSNLYQGGMIGPEDAMKFVSSNLPAIPLTGAWRYHIEHDFGFIEPPVPPGQGFGNGNPNTPNILFDSMITPLVPAAMRGVLWYQGESNASRARHYRQLFPLMIRDWRRVFGQPALRFYFAQITGYGQSPTLSGISPWAELREAQTFALREPHTSMAVTIDIGDQIDVHPKNKQDVGKRLARHALADVYGKAIETDGPTYRSHRVEGDTIRIEFDHADGLRTTDGEPVKGFTIAGVDKIFGWAEARIEGTTVVVRSAKVPKPVMVRYAWADYAFVNLVNGAGLPAGTFRTEME